MGNRGGRANARMTQLVLETYGRQCWLRLPGCTGIATTKDHIVPFSHGGRDELENYRPACRRCNSKRQNRVMAGYGASVVVVTGPPAGGKSTYVLEHAKPADVVIDLDRLALALMPVTPDRSHEYPDHVRRVAIRARKGAIHAATRLHERVTVWLIHAVPTTADMAEYQALRWQLVVCDPGRAVVMQRIRTMRPADMTAVAERWYAQHPDTTLHVPAETVLSGVPSSEPDW